jgi:hypothetical protein
MDVDIRPWWVLRLFMIDALHAVRVPTARRKRCATRDRQPARTRTMGVCVATADSIHRLESGRPGGTFIERA